MRCGRTRFGSGTDFEVESWVDWQIRTLRAASSLLHSSGIDVGAILREERVSWGKHISRFGIDGRELHLLKLVLSWRCMGWWRLQQRFNDHFPSEAFKHPGPFHPRRWEDCLPSFPCA